MHERVLAQFQKYVLARFHQLRPIQRFAFTTSLALVAFALISALTAHGGAAASAQVTTNPAPSGTVNLGGAFGASGTCPSNGLLDLIVTPYCSATTGWLTNGLAYAQHFFEILIGIELAWSAILWVFQKEQLGELLAAFIVKLMGIWFFELLIINASTWLPAILESFAQLGATVTGKTADLDPSDVLSVGINMCNAIFAYLPQPNFVTDPGFFGSNIPNLIQTDLTICFSLLVAIILAAIICFIVFISFLMVAGQLIMTLIELYIMIGAGAVMLGFTGSRWTMSFGEKYIGYSLSIGVKLFVTYVILALGMTLFPVGTISCAPNNGSAVCTYLQMIRGTDLSNINNLGGLVLGDLLIAATAIIFMMLAMRLPGLAASMMNGSPSLTLGSAMSAAQTAVGAIAGTVGAVVNTAQTVVKEGGMAVMDAAMLGAGSAGGAAGGGGGGGGGGGSMMPMGGGEAAGGGGGDDVGHGRRCWRRSPKPEQLGHGRHHQRRRIGTDPGAPRKRRSGADHRNICHSASGILPASQDG